MNRSLVVLAGIGFGGCVAMAGMLQYVLKAQADNILSPELQQVMDTHGSSLEGALRLKVREMTRDDGAIELVAQVHATPRTGYGSPRLAVDMGRMVWRSVGSERVIDRLEVIFQPGNETFRVPAPYFSTRVYRPGAAPAVNPKGAGATRATGEADTDRPLPATPDGKGAPQPGSTSRPAAGATGR